RDLTVTGVQTCALPISRKERRRGGSSRRTARWPIPSGPGCCRTRGPTRRRRSSSRPPCGSGDLHGGPARSPAEVGRGRGRRSGRSEERRVGKECEGGGG